MLVDVEALQSGTRLSADVCVVGAGVAGITVALSLVEKGRSVLLVESGGLEYAMSLRSLPSIARRHLFGAQRLAGGRNTGLGYYPLRFTRARALGGTSRTWKSHGLQAAPLSPIDFEERPGKFRRWPIQLAELAPYYEQAQAICNLGPFRYDVGYWEGQGFGSSLLLDAETVESTMFQFGRNSAFNRFEPDLRQAPDVQLLLGTTTTSLDVDASGAVTKANCRTEAGTGLTVEAERFVLAAGALENARILRLSGDEDSGGIGNSHDLVGRFFMEHPDVSVGHFIPKPGFDLREIGLYFPQPVNPKVDAHAMLRLTDETLRSRDLLNSVMRMRLSHVSAMTPAMRSYAVVRRSVHYAVPVAGRHVGRVAVGFPWIVRSLNSFRRDPPNSVELDLMAEQEPNPDSRVAFGPRRDGLGMPITTLDWRLSDKDWASMARSVEILAHEIQALGIGEVVPSIGDGLRRRVFGNWHQMGTTRMSDDPALGVVNGNCRVHSTPNLYIAGASVFPTGGYANPTLTIVALAIRLAQHVYDT